MADRRDTRTKPPAGKRRIAGRGNVSRRESDISRLSGPVVLAVLALAVAIAVAVAHWPVLDAGVVNLDDQVSFFENPVLQNPSWASAGIVMSELFGSATVEGYYEPLTLLSLMLDVAAGGRIDDLRPFHVTSLALHVCNTVLIVVLLYMLFGHPWAAAAVGLLFGVHPLTVEPVAWVWERKTLLAAFFALWCLILYVRYVRRQGVAAYLGSLAMLVLALLAKPTVTPLPAMLLLLDFWPLHRLSKRVVLEKVPYFAIAGISAVITVVSTARTAPVAVLGGHSLIQLPLKICYLIGFYLCKIVWPTNLSSIYVLPDPMSLMNPVVLVAVVGTCVLVGLLVLSLRWTRGPVMAGLFFVAAISPTLGVVQYSWVAASDKYVYLPAIGLLIVLASLIERLAARPARGGAAWRPAFVCIGVLAAASVLAFGARQYLREWRTSERYGAHMLGLAPDSPYTQYYYGNVLRERKDYDLAIDRYTRTIELKPDFADAYNNRAMMYGQKGDHARAIQDSTRAIELDPGYHEAYNNRGNAHVGMGNPIEAIRDYTRAIELKQDFVQAYLNRANACVTVGDLNQAIRDCSRVIELRPNFAQAYVIRGAAYGRQRDYDRAIRDCSRAIELKSDDATAYHGRGAAYGAKQDYVQAVRDFTDAIRLDPTFAQAYYNRGTAYDKMGDFVRAIEDYARAIELKPDYVTAYNNRGNSYARQHDFGRAIGDYTKAIELKPDFAPAYANRAEAYYSSKQYDKAWADVRLCRQHGGILSPDLLANLAKASGGTE